MSGEPVNTGDELPVSDFMTWTCGELIGPNRYCNTVTQGGRRGLELHRQTVHGEPISSRHRPTGGAS